MKMYANLHNHTTHSDGPYTPLELVKVAKEEGYKALAVTDHDTATAYPELVDACKKEGMDCIFGVEFTVLVPTDYHVTAFGFDPEYPEMKKYLSDMGKRQTDNTKCCFDEAVAKGNIEGITWEEVLKDNENIKWLCNNHVFATMIKKGMVKQNDYMEWFEKNFRKQRAKYPPKISFKTLPELTDLIKRAGGISVIAHPHNRLSDMEYLIKNGINGIEVWHPDLTEEEQKEAFDIAMKHNLFISGGSDHSGLCGGFYPSYKNMEEALSSRHYCAPLSAGTTKEFYKEIKNLKLNR